MKGSVEFCHILLGCPRWIDGKKQRDGLFEKVLVSVGAQEVEGREGSGDD